MMCSLVLFLRMLMCPVLDSPESGADWKESALQRIEQIRKAEVIIQVVDADGNPVSEQGVHVSMQRHAFPWGSCVKASRIMGTGPDDEIYRAKLLELFNAAVLENDLKWNAIHGAYGPSYTWEQTLAAMKWLKDREYFLRGHCMVWAGWKYFEPWGKSLGNDLPQLQQRILDHITLLADRTRDYMNEWDVLNEPLHHNEVIDTLGDGCIAEWFNKARSVLPDSCKLFINEYNIVEPFSAKERDAYETLIRELLDAKAPLEGIGFQSHFVGVPESPAEALQVFDRFAQFNLPIVVTEFDVSTADEARQAQFTRDFMTAAFSHAACTGFTFWGFFEPDHWRSDAAMFRSDWSEKPNLHAYRDLVLKEWWTDEMGSTNERGELSLRAFKGKYSISVGEQTRAVDIVDSPTIIKIVL